MSEHRNRITSSSLFRKPFQHWFNSAAVVAALFSASWAFLFTLTISRNIQIQATFNNPKNELLPGMYAKVVVNLGQAQKYLTLPQTAITFNPYGSTVFVIEEQEGKTPEGAPDGKKQKVAKQVFVTTGETRGDQVAIVKGLKEGQEVVTTGQLKLKNGTPVVIDNTITPDNNPSPTPQEH